MRCTFLWVFLMITGAAMAQQAPNEILLMTGKIVHGQVTGRDSLHLFYEFGSKEKAKKLDLERVFAWTTADGSEQVLYQVDTTAERFFTVDEMRYYIQGEQDARKSYKANWTLLAGVPLAAAAGFALNGSVVVFTVPFLTMVLAGIPSYTIRAKQMSNTSLITQPAYVLGFERTARNKRLFKALGGAVVGAAAGVLVGRYVVD